MPVVGPIPEAINQSEKAAPTRNTVHQVVDAKVLAVEYTDGYHNTQMRLVVMLGDSPFLLPKEVSENAASVQKWLAEGIQKKLEGETKSSIKKKAPTKQSKKKQKTETKESSLPPIDVDAI